MARSQSHQLRICSLAAAFGLAFALSPRLARRSALKTPPLSLDHRLPLKDATLNENVGFELPPSFLPLMCPSETLNDRRQEELRGNGGLQPKICNILDTLRDDYPYLFDQEPDLSIYTDDIEVTDPSGVPLIGKTNYQRMWAGLRAMKRYAMRDARLRYSMLYCQASNTVRVFWSVDVVLKPAIALYIAAGSEQEPIRIDGISVYHVNSDGLVYKHSVENLNYNNKLNRYIEAAAFDLQAWAAEVQRRHKRAWHTGHAAAFDFDKPLWQQLERDD